MNAVLAMHLNDYGYLCFKLETLFHPSILGIYRFILTCLQKATTISTSGINLSLIN